MACAAWSEPYYRSVAATVLSLTCYERTGAPTTPSDFLARLDGAHLKAAWAGTTSGPVAAALGPQDVQGVRYRYFTLISDMERGGAIPTAAEPGCFTAARPCLPTAWPTRSRSCACSAPSSVGKQASAWMPVERWGTSARCENSTNGG